VLEAAVQRSTLAQMATRESVGLPGPGLSYRTARRKVRKFGKPGAPAAASRGAVTVAHIVYLPLNGEAELAPVGSTTNERFWFHCLDVSVPDCPGPASNCTARKNQSGPSPRYARRRPPLSAKGNAAARWCPVGSERADDKRGTANGLLLTPNRARHPFSVAQRPLTKGVPSAPGDSDCLYI
jgi:hypothetical protein